MASRLPPHFLDLVANALLQSFWRRRALHSFLRRVGIRESFLATWRQEESKRDLIYRMFPVLERTEAGTEAIQRMARELADQTAFPDLEGWEESVQMKARAATAVRDLSAYLAKQRQVFADEKAQAESRKRAQAMREERARQQADLDALRARLDGLAQRIGKQDAGYEFQGWFYELVEYYEVVNRRPYVTAGRQIDGSLTVDGTTYIIELKFTAEQAAATDVDSFFKKTHDKADNTMGVMVSMSGYSSVAVKGASGPRTPLLLLDYGHLYRLLSGTITLQEMVNRLRRHASQTGEAYLPAADL
ncbi:hypothetical protein [Roseisolibacter sp. H3M3-2]|uniref:hypothetical protein n=1 Tax=Roseisolibacter sp. H3M3-2 TaxID=3031323 RepID=UPI0023DA2610|nr:hypothetical protein [Roseisolibacter sp. H3M3-2]MDF1502686.1 hypothetical protein [Roseisolibacter sp. H3M3-2]